MNSETGQLYPSFKEALADLRPDEPATNVVEVRGDPETVEALARSIQQFRKIERERAANKAARAARRQNRKN